MSKPRQWRIGYADLLDEPITPKKVSPSHAKGPWGYIGPDAVETGHTIRVRDSFEWVANCGQSYLFKGRHNAQRIVDCVNALEGFADPSAAPDLLEAAKEAVVYIRDLRATPGLGSILDSLEQAIAKAEGTK